MVGLREGEAEHIEKLQDWKSVLGVDGLFIRTSMAHKTKTALAKHEDGRCVFLGQDNLCEIHRHHGLQAKPFACQLYPFVLSPVGGKIRVGLRFDCPAVCKNEGRVLSDHYKGVNDLAKHLIPSGYKVEKAPCPDLKSGVKLSSQRFEAFNESLMKIVSSNAVPLWQRLQWMRKFLEHIDQVKWKNVGDEDFAELLNLLEGGLLAEIVQQQQKRHQPTVRARKMIGQIFFLLSQPPQHQALMNNQGYFKRIASRLDQAKQMKLMGNFNGPLPKVQPDWPVCDLQALEKSFGSITKEMDELLTRYMICRIGGVNYCGPNFYQYSVVNGTRSLILGLVTAGWLMRVHALKSNRDSLNIDDTVYAIMTIDGNMGYSKALGMGAAKLRLDYLRGHLETLINWYCT